MADQESPDSRELYSSESPKRISRARLELIRGQLLTPLRTNPPTIGSYPREVDVELFKLFNSAKVTRAEKSAITLGGRQIRRAREVWVYETTGTDSTYFDEQGVFRSEYIEFDPPHLTEVPEYTSNTEDALVFMWGVLDRGWRLFVEEVEKENDVQPLWRAKIIDASDRTVGEGETYDCAASVVLAVLSNLLANDKASWWIEVADDL
jgi:hypothetical protein